MNEANMYLFGEDYAAEKKDIHSAKLKILADHPKHLTLLREIDKEVCGK